MSTTSRTSSSSKTMPSYSSEEVNRPVKIPLPPDFNLKQEIHDRQTRRVSGAGSSGSLKSAPSFVLDEEKGRISLQKDIQNTKSFLMQCGDTGISLWTHLTELLKKVVEEHPTNVIDYFEEFSRRLKVERFATVNKHLRDVYTPPTNLEFAEKRLNLIKAGGVPLPDEFGEEAEPDNIGGETDEGVTSGQRIGFMEFMHIFREAGVGLPKDKCYTINLAIRNLSRSAPVKSVRFWGVIYGLRNDYVVAECELNEAELNRRLEEQMVQEEGEEGRAIEDLENTILQEQIMGDYGGEEVGEEEELLPQPVALRYQFAMPPEPRPQEKTEVIVPSEKDGEGINRKVYYVCSDPGDKWILLPNLTPQQIIDARRIKRYLTGDLNATVNSFPPFHGKEKDYLRAQIARISAATQISPLGYYTFHEMGEEEEDVPEEEEETKSTFVENTEFEPLPIKDMTDQTMAFWVHHSQHILKQGRTKWWSNKPQMDEEAVAEEGEEEDFEGEAEVPELGPPLLTPLSEDVSLETTTPWTVRISSVYTPENATAIVSSNLWPGAYAFATGRIFGNLYLGWGHKYSGSGYSPMPLPFPEDEYPEGPEVMEVDDPTPQAEEEWRLSHEPKVKQAEHEEGEEEEEAEEEADVD